MPRRPATGKGRKGRARKKSEVVRLSDLPEEKIEWLWRGRFAKGKFHLIDGDPDVGKSSITWDIAARLSRGGQLPDGATCKPTPVLILTSEDGFKDTIKPAIRAAGGDQGNIFALSLRKDKNGLLIPFTIPDDIERLRTALKQSGAEFVVIDPIMGFLSEDIQSGNDASARRALEPLADVARKERTAIVGIRHLKKDQREKNPLYRGGGSIAFTATARVSFLCARHPEATSEHDPRRVFAPISSRLMRKAYVPSLEYEVEEWDEDAEVRVVKWGEPSPITAEQLLRGSDARRLSPALDDAKEVLSEILDVDGWLSMDSVYEQLDQAGVSRDTGKRAIKEIGAHKWAERDTSVNPPSIVRWRVHGADRECPDECPHRVRIA